MFSEPFPEEFDVAVSAGMQRTYAVRLPALDDRVGGGSKTMGVMLGDKLIARSAVDAANVEKFAMAVDGGGELVYFGKADPEHHTIKATMTLSVLARLLHGLTRDEPVDATEPWKGVKSVPVGKNERVMLFLGYCTGSYTGEIDPRVFAEHMNKIMDGETTDPIASAIDDLLEGK